MYRVVMRRFAIFLSSEKYTNYSDTDYCHADSDNLKNILIERCDYPKENILQLKLSPESDKEAVEILKDIEELLGRSEAGDSILFFYAGHGQAINGESYLILPGTKNFDAATSSLALRDIHHFLSGNQRLNIRIFDCCHSGENIRGGPTNESANEFVKSILLDGGDGTVTFSSCAISEKSYPDDNIRQGVFTSALVQAIASIPDDSAVFIESLKLDVCERVQKWSEERGKKQTPTLTMHVNGNMPIAFTKKPQVTPVISIGATDLSFEERLSKLREAEVVNEDFYPVLTETVAAIAEEIDKEGKEFNYHGLGLKAGAPSSSESIPAELVERIVLNMKDKNTMHGMEVERKKRVELGMQFMLSPLFKPAPEYDVYYRVTQSSNMPDSFVEAALDLDKITPVSRIFFYVCPLQATVAIIGGYYFDIGYNSERNLRIIMQSPLVFSLQEIRNREYISAVGSVIALFKHDLHVEVMNRMNILEQELARAALRP
jgi:hypothetical protein